ncbi:MAG TPA: carboxypeptidase-like regulatory domain-containing protein [Thermoanaerobaculia bacterium]
MRSRLLLALLVLAPLANAAVTGRVITEEGKPLEGARVRAYAIESSETFFARVLSDKPEATPIASGTTAADGTFRLDVKGSPVVDVIVDAEGRGEELIRLADGDDTGARVLAAAKPRRGRITSGGKPVANATVLPGGLLAVRTDEEGYWQAPNGNALMATLVVIHSDFALIDERRLDTGVALTMTKGVAVSGRVVAEDGETPVANAQLYVDGWPLAKSAEDGTFSIAHAAPDWRSLVARAGTRVAAVTKGAPPLLRLQPGGSVSGTVRSAKDDTPIAGAAVTINGDATLRGLRRVVADAKGNFSIDGVIPASWNLGASHPSFATAAVSVRVDGGQRLTRGVALQPFAKLTGTVTDEERKPVAGVRFSTVRGSRASAVSATDGSFVFRFPTFDVPVRIAIARAGFATITQGPLKFEPGETRRMNVTLPRGFPLSIKLVDGAGEPVPDEPVYVMWAEETNGLPVPCAEAEGCNRSSGDGTYETRLVEGSYELRIGGDKTALKRIAPQTLNAASSPMTVTLDRGAKVTGRVVDRDGNALGDDDYLTIRVKEQPQVFATVEKDGTFSISGLLPGRITLLGARGRPGTANQVSAPPVEVDAPASNVVIQFPNPARIEGRVTEKESGTPVTEFTVSMQASGSAWTGGPPAPFRADDGSFVLEDAPVTTTQLVVNAPGYVPGRITGLTLEEGKSVTVEVALERGVKIAGRVTAAGRAVAGVSVSSLPAGPMMRGPREQNRSTVTDDNGDYVLDGVATGAFRLEFHKSGYVTLVKAIETTAGKDQRLDAELERGRELNGRVIDTTGQPVSGAMVYVDSRSMSSRGNVATTDAEGTFRLEGLAEGTYAVKAEKSGYLQGKVEDVEAAPGRSVTITLNRGGSISGRVTGLTEQELGSAMVMMIGGRAGGRSEARVDANGSFTLTGVPDGEVTVMARLMGGRRGQGPRQTVTVVNGAAPAVELNFAEGIVVRGRVLRAGRPFTNAMVYFRGTAEGQPVPMNEPGMTAGDGTYEVRVTAPGEYRVQLGVNMTTYDGGTVHVTGPMTHDIELRGSTVRGRVVDADTGAPLNSVSLQLRRPSAADQWTTSDASGAFVFELVSDDAYQLTASRDRYATAMESVDVRGGEVRDLEIRLRRGLRTALRVVDGQGRPVDASVRVSNDADQSMWMGIPSRGEDGALSLWLQPGTYTAAIFAPGYSAAEARLMVPGPEVTVVLMKAVR